MGRRPAIVLSVLLVALGLAIVGRTIAEGVGGGLGLALGAMMAAAGALRLFLARR